MKTKEMVLYVSMSNNISSNRPTSLSVNSVSMETSITGVSNIDGCP